MKKAARLLGREPHAGVDHAETCNYFVALSPLHLYPDAHAALGGELDGVVGVVDQYLAQPQRVAHQAVRHLGCHLAGQHQSFGRGLALNHVDDLIQHIGQLKRYVLQREFASFNLGDIQDVVNDRQQVLSSLLDLDSVVGLARVQPGLAHQVGHADDGVHRRADFVAHVGQKVPF